MSHKKLERHIAKLTETVNNLSGIVNHLTGSFNSFNQRFQQVPATFNNQFANTGTGNGVQVNFGPNGTANIQLTNFGNTPGSIPNVLVNGQPIGIDSFSGSNNIQWPNLGQISHPDCYPQNIPYSNTLPVSYSPVSYSPTYLPTTGHYEHPVRQRPTIGFNFSLPI